MSNFTAQKQILGLLAWLVLCFVIAAIGAMGSMNAPEFYGQLIQPTWAPPAWLFGPVWSTLYTLMGVAAWMVWRQGGLKDTKLPMVLFLIQLAVNALWSWLFFAWQMGVWSMVDIIVLWVLIVMTIVAFWRVNKLAALLMIPYLLWVSFAAVLNYYMWQLNPSILA